MEPMNLSLYLIVIAIGYMLIKRILQDYQFQRLVHFLNHQDYESCQSLLRSKLTFLAFDPFNIQFMKLNVALAEDKKEDIDDSFTLFDKMPMNKKQQIAVYKKALLYYAAENDKNNVNKYLDLCGKVDDDSFQHELEYFKDIYIDKGYRYLEEFIDLYSKQNDQELAYMISLMYRNMGDEEKVDEYREPSQEMDRS